MAFFFSDFFWVIINCITTRSVVGIHHRLEILPALEKGIGFNFEFWLSVLEHKLTENRLFIQMFSYIKRFREIVRIKVIFCQEEKFPFRQN